MHDDKFESLDWVPGEIRPESDYEAEEAAHFASQWTPPNWWPEPWPESEPDSA